VPNSLSHFDPFGNFRTPPTGSNPTITNHGYTGHRHNNTGNDNLGLIYMNARYYLPEVGRFISPDTIVPEPGNPQSFNRHAYSANNPVKYNDPSGHWFESVLDIASIAYDIYEIQRDGLNTINGACLAVDVVGLALSVVTGGGVAVRALAHGDDIGDALRLAGHLGDGTHAIVVTNRLRQVGSESADGAKLVKELAELGTKGSLESGSIVALGHGDSVRGIPGFKEWATTNSATYLDLPEEVYQSLLESGNWWSVNQQLLDNAMAAKSMFHLQLPKAEWPGWFKNEIEHILKSGNYELLEDGADYWLKPK
jgi:RHS repeat-associated protein